MFCEAEANFLLESSNKLLIVYQIFVLDFQYTERS